MESDFEDRFVTYRGKDYYVGDEVTLVLLHGNPEEGNGVICREDTNRVMLIDKKSTMKCNAFDTIKARITYIGDRFSIIYPIEVIDRAGTKEMADIVRSGGVDAEPAKPAPPPYRPESCLETSTLFELEPYTEIVDFYARALLDPDHQTMLDWSSMDLTVEQQRAILAKRGKKVMVVLRNNKNEIICTPFTEKLLDTSINVPHQLNEALQYYDKVILMVILYTV